MSNHLFSSFSRLLGSRRGKKSPITSAKKLKHNRKRPGRHHSNLELLEGRVVPAYPLVASVLGGTPGTAIVGTVYEDLDSNGVRNNGENGVSGWTVYLDLDQSGTLNTDAVGDREPSAVTDRDGNYLINRLIPGTYRVSEVVQSGWSPTAPVSQDVLVALDRDTLVDFFNFSGGDIVGTVWNDLSADGVRDATEPGLADWTVFLDFDNDRLVDPGEPTTLTNAGGGYSFVNLPPGDYEVTEVLPGGWEVSPGFDTRQTAAVVARTQVSQDFANFSLLNGSIQGTIWNDLNADGIRNTNPVTGAFTEPGLAGWTVFLDLNVNRVADPAEPTTLTNASGAYSFLSLPAGDYEVTEILPSGWYVSRTFDSRQTVTVFGGEASVARDFANFTVLNGSIRGIVWNDLNRNGIREVSLAGTFTDPGLPNWTVYLDLNHNNLADVAEPTALTDANGVYRFLDLQVGDYEIREILPSGWEVTPTYSDSVGVTVYSGAESVAPAFANFNLATALPGSISGTVWNDRNGNGRREVDPVSGTFTDPGLAGWTVFIDRNANGSWDATEPRADSAADGSYSIAGILPGSISIIEQVKPGWRATAPSTGVRALALKNGENATGLDFGNWALQDSGIRGVVFADLNKDGTRNAGERGLDGITVYLDLNNNRALDAGEPQTATSADLYYTPTVDEAGTYSFTHLAAGTYTVRAILPAILSATPATELEHLVTLVGAESRSGVDCAAVFRPTEIHGIKFDDRDGDHVRDAGEPGVGGVTVFVDLNRDDVQDASEPTTVTLADGSYSFSDLAPGAYVIREVLTSGYEHTYPTTTGGILWPQGVSNPAVGTVTPTSITTALATGQTYSQTVSITLPNTGALTNLVDVFLLFDDTGSFVNNSPIVRAAFPTIIAQLQAALPGIDLGFGVGRFEEYANFASEYATGRPFILNQPIVAASTTGYLTAIQAALNRTTPGYGGDQPETDIEALYQLVTGLGFDGNNNGSVLDSGVAGLASTQLNPGASGDVPSFASFRADPAGNVIAAAGTIGGGGFRAGALPIILVATDTGFAYQPRGETSITGVGGLTLPLSALTGTSRPTTPFNAGAGFQQTITGLNALGALVIGLGTNPQANVAPRQGLEALSNLTGAINRTTATIPNGTPDPIAPGDPFYFQIASGFAGSVASGVTSAIQNAVTNVAVDITVQASDPRVRIVNRTGVRTGVGSGQTATFDIEFVGDGVPRRFDLLFVRAGTNVVLGSIPVVLGTPVPGDGYEFEDLREGEIHNSVDFGSHLVTSTTIPTITVNAGAFIYDGSAHAATATATGIGGVPVTGTFAFTYNGSTALPVAAGVYNVVAAFTSTDPNYANATGTATLTVSAATPTIAVAGGTFTFDGTTHAATATATGVGGALVTGTFAFTYNGSTALPAAAGVYEVTASFTSTDPNHANATGTATLTITAATPTIAVAGGAFTFDGATHAATATATGIGGVPVAGTFSLTYNGSAAPALAAGVYNIVATFTSTDPNYANASGTATLTISAATPTIAVAGGTFTFDGATHVATATATGIGGVPVAGTFSLTYNGSATPASAAGVYNIVATFSSTDPNYANASGTATLTISAATPTIAVVGGSYTYDGSAHAATATATGVVGELVAGTFAFTYNGSPALPVAAGSYNVVAAFTSTDPNYTNGTGTATLTIGAPTPTITVSGGPFTYDGTAHTATAVAIGLDGVTPVSGSFAFTYNGSAVAPTVAGTYVVAATFTSSDPNYANATGSGNLTINPTAPTVTVSGGSYSYDGTPHAASAVALGVDGVTPVSGSFSFTYNGSAAAPVAAGTYAVVASFTSGDPNYTGASAGGSLIISPATPAFSNLSLPTIPAGTASVILSGHLAAGSAIPSGGSMAITLNGVTQTATVDGSGNFSVSFTTGGLPASSYPVTYAFAGDGANFLAAPNGSGTLTVTAVSNAPRVTTQPQSQTVVSGARVSFTAAACGNPAPTVQWQVSHNGGKTFSNIKGATSGILTVTAKPGHDGNLYRAVFTNAAGKAVTEAATLTVQTPPRVICNPKDREVFAGSWVTFTAAAVGFPAPVVQWQVSIDGGKTFSNIAGANSIVLRFVARADQDDYQYRAVFTSAAGTALTEAATLGVKSRSKCDPGDEDPARC